MKCVRCGHEGDSNNNRFCSQCGGALVPPDTQGNPISTGTPVVPVAPANNTKSWIVAIVALVLVLALVGGGIWFLLSRSKNVDYSNVAESPLPTETPMVEPVNTVEDVISESVEAIKSVDYEKCVELMPAAWVSLLELQYGDGERYELYKSADKALKHFSGRGANISTLEAKFKFADNISLKALKGKLERKFGRTLPVDVSSLGVDEAKIVRVELSAEWRNQRNRLTTEVDVFVVRMGNRWYFLWADDSAG